jgi:hypothetical protein
MMSDMTSIARHLSYPGLAFCLAVFVVGSTVGDTQARDHVDAFDDESTTWTVIYDRSAATVKRHVRSAEVRHAGQAAELIEFEVAPAMTVMHMAYQLPPARLIDDTRLSLWYYSTLDAALLSARVVLPNQIDPETGTNFTVPIEGDSYTKVGQWQKLECKDIDRKFKQMLPQIRRRLQSSGGQIGLDITGRYVDTVLVTIRSGRGAARCVFDDVRFGPIVAVDVQNGIRQVQRENSVPEPEARFQLGQLNVRGKPFFIRAVPYHGELPADLGRMRLNLVWVPDYKDTRLLAELDQAGLRTMAVPPEAPAQNAVGQIGNVSMHLAPFGDETSRVSFWYLGTQIKPAAKRDISAWEEQIRNADRLFERPLMGDVAGLERTYSQHFDMLGVHRPAVQTSFSPKHYRDWLIEHRNLAQPGTFLWTWIQTEAPPSVAEVRAAAGWRPQVVEPEQLRLQVYAALSAGCRGIAFWTNSSLDDDRPGSAERKQMIAILNMELELLEPLLARGSVIGQASISVPAPVRRKSSAVNSPTNAGKSSRVREQELSDRDNELRLKDEIAHDLEAAVIHTDDSGILVLPVWYAREAQYVPGPMAANNATIVVPGVGESARAYEISTTEVRELQTVRVTGGRQVILQKFDMTAAILFTENGALVERLREQVKTLRESVSRAALELARAKLERVAAVDGDLNKLGRGQVDSVNLLSAAKRYVVRAETFWQAQRFNDSRIAAANALQSLRILQHAHWSDASHRMYSPVSSPHALCFQTLPDHWNMIARFGRTLGADSRNRLRSGDCEDLDTMVAEGWTRAETAISGVRSTAELHARAHTGTYALRLAAAPAAGLDPPVSISERPVTVVSPPITVYKGQLVYISGWVKLEAPSLCNLEGAVFYDSLGGPATALRWRNKADWQFFDLAREVTETTELTLTMALSGLGDVRFDDLAIIPLDVDSSPGKGNGKSALPAARRGRGGPLDFLRRLPGFGGKTEPD